MQAVESQARTSTSTLPPEDTLQALDWHIRRWNTRLRLVRSLIWVPRGLLLGVLFGLMVAGISRLRPWLLPEEILQNALIAVALTGFFSAALIWLWPRRQLASARDFDLRFELKERMSTAIELLTGVIFAPMELMQLQLEDARIAANRTKHTEWLPLRVKWLEIGALLIAILLLVLSITLENPFTQNVLEQQALQEELQERQEELREASESVEDDASLSEQQVEELTEPIDEAIEALENEDISQQEAVAELTQAEQELREMGEDGMNTDEREAFQSAGEQLRASPPSEQLGEAMENRDLEEAAQETEELSNDLNNLDEQDRQELADQLESAADALQETNPELADQLREAAEALREGDIEAAEQALQEAAETLNEQSQANQQQADAARQLQQDVSRSRQEMTEFDPSQAGESGNSEQNQQDQGQEGTQQESGEQQGGQQGQQGEGQEGNTTSQGQQSDTNQQGEGEQSSSASGSESQGQEGENTGQGQNSQASESGGSEGESSQGQEGQQGQANASSPGGEGAGEGASTAGEGDTQNSPGNQPGEIDNSPGDDDERDYEPVYNPSRIGEDGEAPELSLSGEVSDDEGDPLQEAEFNDEFSGESTVPYNEVFGDYQGEAQRALESDYIPINLRDLVRAYFTSIEPE